MTRRHILFELRLKRRLGANSQPQGSDHYRSSSLQATRKNLALDACELDVVRANLSRCQFLRATPIWPFHAGFFTWQAGADAQDVISHLANLKLRVVSYSTLK